MSYAYHLAGNALVLIVVYWLVHRLVSPETSSISADDSIAEYKLITHPAEEDADI